MMARKDVDGEQESFDFGYEILMGVIMKCVVTRAIPSCSPERAVCFSCNVTRINRRLLTWADMFLYIILEALSKPHGITTHKNVPFKKPNFVNKIVY
jgi:hypothetical protein